MTKSPFPWACGTWRNLIVHEHVEHDEISLSISWQKLLRKDCGCGAHVVLLFQKVQNSPVKWTNIVSNYTHKGRKNTKDTDWILTKKMYGIVLYMFNCTHEKTIKHLESWMEDDKTPYPCWWKMMKYPYPLVSGRWWNPLIHKLMEDEEISLSLSWWQMVKSPVPWVDGRWWILSISWWKMKSPYPWVDGRWWNLLIHELIEDDEISLSLSWWQVMKSPDPWVDGRWRSLLVPELMADDESSLSISWWMMKSPCPWVVGRWWNLLIH